MRCFIPVTVFLTLNIARAEYESTGGWTPISNEEAYRRLNLNVSKDNNVQLIDQPLYQNVNLTLDGLTVNKNDALKLVEPQKLYGEFKVKKMEPSVNKTSVNIKPITDNDEMETLISTNIRKAKNINEHHKDLAFNNEIYMKTLDIKEEYHDNEDDNDIRKETIEKNVTKTYEVTQSSEATDLAPIKVDGKTGYVYSTPEIIPHQAQNNLTNKFLNILDKYNINNNDELINYAKSRVTNLKKSKKDQIIYFPIPLRFLERYNSMNHLSVDPLMAVFLSNYGYYLPYTYSIHNNYRNLYGYLASNNIHNNKPFGSYKVFSDTDSSS